MPILENQIVELRDICMPFNNNQFVGGAEKIKTILDYPDVDIT